MDQNTRESRAEQRREEHHHPLWCHSKNETGEEGEIEKRKGSYWSCKCWEFWKKKSFLWEQQVCCWVQQTHFHNCVWIIQTCIGPQPQMLNVWPSFLIFIIYIYIWYNNNNNNNISCLLWIRLPKWDPSWVGSCSN